MDWAEYGNDSADAQLIGRLESAAEKRCHFQCIILAHLESAGVEDGELAVLLGEVEIAEHAEGDHRGRLVADLQVANQLLDLNLKEGA